MRYKYSKIYHVPWSKSITNDDEVLSDDDLKLYKNKKVVLTLKMDGECTTKYNDHYHARSIDSKDHISRHHVKQLHSRIKYDIPDNWRICGENLEAKHSLKYNNIDSYFMVFSIFNENNIHLSLKETLEWCDLLNLWHVPILDIIDFDENKIKEYCNNLNTDINEGICIRNIDSFHFSDFKNNYCKYVRKNHVQTDEHWMYKPIERNTLNTTSIKPNYMVKYKL